MNRISRESGEREKMKIRMYHTDIGDGYLTTEHSSSSYGQPVFASDDGTMYGPGDKYPRHNCNTGYLHRVDGVEYSEEDVQWVNDYIVRTHLKGYPRSSGGCYPRRLVWEFGSTWKTSGQLAEIERRNGERMILNA